MKWVSDYGLKEERGLAKKKKKKEGHAKNKKRKKEERGSTKFDLRTPLSCQVGLCGPARHRTLSFPFYLFYSKTIYYYFLYSFDLLDINFPLQF